MDCSQNNDSFALNKIQKWPASDATVRIGSGIGGQLRALALMLALFAAVFSAAGQQNPAELTSEGGAISTDESARDARLRPSLRLWNSRTNASDSPLTADSALRYGRWIFRPGVSNSISYNDNVFARERPSANADSEDVIHRISADLSFSVMDASEDYFLIPSLSYTPELVLFHDNSDQNTLNHYGHFELKKVLSKTVIRLDHTSSSIQETSAEAANLEGRNTHQTYFAVSYEPGGKIMVELEATQQFQQRKRSDIKEWREDLWFNYLWLPKVEVGVGIGGGFVTVERGRDSFLHADQVRFRYYPKQKLAIEIRGGIETRFFQGNEGRTMVGPIAEITVNYDLLHSTRLSFRAVRQQKPSLYIEDQLTDYTSVVLDLHQRFGDRWFATLNGSYVFAKPESATANGSAASSYDYYHVGLEAGYQFNRRARGAVYYRHIERSAGGGYHSFDANEVGFNFSYHF